MDCSRNTCVMNFNACRATKDGSNTLGAVPILTPNQWNLSTEHLNMSSETRRCTISYVNTKHCTSETRPTSHHHDRLTPLGMWELTLMIYTGHSSLTHYCPNGNESHHIYKLNGNKDGSKKILRRAPRLWDGRLRWPNTGKNTKFMQKRVQAAMGQLVQYIGYLGNTIFHK